MQHSGCWAPHLIAHASHSYLPDLVEDTWRQSSILFVPSVTLQQSGCSLASPHFLFTQFYYLFQTSCHMPVIVIGREGEMAGKRPICCLFNICSFLSMKARLGFWERSSIWGAGPAVHGQEIRRKAWKDQVVGFQSCRELKGFELVKMHAKFKESLYILMKSFWFFWIQMQTR